MYEYTSINTVAQIKQKELSNLSNDDISMGITSELEKIITNTTKETEMGWEIISHCVQFFGDRQIISLLLRRQIIENMRP